MLFWEMPWHSQSSSPLAVQSVLADVCKFKLVDALCCGCKLTCTVCNHLMQVSSFPFKTFVLKMLFRYIERERLFPLGKGNRASSSHLSHNMPGHRSKSHTNTFSCLASRSLSSVQTHTYKSLWCCGCSHFGLVCPSSSASEHNLLAWVLHHTICFSTAWLPLYCTSYTWLLSGYHTFCLVPYVQFSRKGI